MKFRQTNKTKQTKDKTETNSDTENKGVVTGPGLGEVRYSYYQL